jgi:hypothetical protein
MVAARVTRREPLVPKVSASAWFRRVGRGWATSTEASLLVVPHPLRGRRGHPSLGGHRPARPVGLAVRRGMPCQINDLVDLLLRDRGFPATPGPDLPQLRQAVLGEPGPPRPNRCRLHPYLHGDPRVRHTIGRQPRPTYDGPPQPAAPKSGRSNSRRCGATSFRQTRAPFSPHSDEDLRW